MKNVAVASCSETQTPRVRARALLFRRKHIFLSSLFLRARCLLLFGQPAFLIIPSLMLVIYHSVLSLRPLCCLRNSRPSSCASFSGLREPQMEKSQKGNRETMFSVRRRMGKSKRRGANGIDKLDFSRTTIKFIKSTLKGRGENKMVIQPATTASRQWFVKCLSRGMPRTSDTWKSELGSINPRHSIIAPDEIISLGSSSI